MDFSIAREKLNRFYSSYPYRQYSKGQILLYAADRPNFAIQLISGQIRQYEITANGSEVVISVFKPPAVVPLWLILDGSASQYFFEANSIISVKVAPREDFLKFLNSAPEVTYDFLLKASSAILSGQKKLAFLLNGSVQERLLFEILNDTKRFGVRSSDGSYMVTISQTELAKKSGLSRETVNRHLQKLASSKLIYLKGRKLIIKDLRKLENKLKESFS